MIRQKLRRGIRYSRVVAYRETQLDMKEQSASFFGAFIGLGLITFLQEKIFHHEQNLFLIGSFGASAVLIFGAIHSPLSQPRNLIGGHIISAFIGVSLYKLFPDLLWITAPLSVALSIAVMQMTKTLHPPGGATALIAVIGSSQIKELGYLYVISPVLTGALILLVTALIFNNITPNRKYPTDRRFTRLFRSGSPKEELIKGS